MRSCLRGSQCDQVPPRGKVYVPYMASESRHFETIVRKQTFVTTAMLPAFELHVWTLLIYFENITPPPSTGIPQVFTERLLYAAPLGPGVLWCSETGRGPPSRACVQVPRLLGDRAPVPGLHP